MTVDNGLDAGDVLFKPGRTVPMDHNDGGAEEGTLRGAPVTINGDMSVTAAAADDFVIGQYADDPAEHEGRHVSVRIGKLVLVALAGGAVNPGDLLAADGNGAFLADNDDDTTSPTPAEYAPYALESAADGDLFAAAYV